MSRMAFLPVVDRELRVAARKRSTYFFRIAVVVAAFFICGWFLLTYNVAWKQSGLILFNRISETVFCAAMLAGIFTTADCISVEKRQGTLGLLFLTNLKGSDVVLGKLAATSLNVIYSILAVLPVLAVPVLLGGVSAADFLMSSSLIAATLFLSLSVGMFVSSLSRTEFEAVLGTVLVLIGVCAIPAIVALFWTMFFPSPGPAYRVGDVRVWHCLSPLGLLANFRQNISFFVANLAVVLAYGLVFLVISGEIVTRVFRDDFGAFLRRFLPGRQKAKETVKPVKPSVSERLHHYRRGLLDANPIVWLVNREPIRVKYVWLVVIIVALAWFAGWCLSNRTWWRWDVTVLFALFLNSLLKLLLGMEAPRQLAEDRRSGSLELILSTPISEREMVSGYSKAIQSQFAKPFIVVVAVELWLLWTGGLRFPDQDVTAMIITVVSLILLFADSVTLTIVGMWNGMVARMPNRAAWRGIVVVLLLPWLLYPLTTVVEQLVRGQAQTYNGYTYYYYNRPWYLEAKNLWIMWLLFCLAYDWFLIRRARSKMNGSFRELAAKTYAGA